MVVERWSHLQEDAGQAGADAASRPAAEGAQQLFLACVAGHTHIFNVTQTHRNQYCNGLFLTQSWMKNQAG